MSTLSHGPSDPESATPLRDRVMPLSEFTADDRERIERLAAADEPPPQWLHFGVDGDRLASIASRAWFEWHWRRDLEPPPMTDPD